MKKTIPLKKELTFKSNLAEITSIALDHDLNLENDVIKGNLVISGSYKINDVSVNTEEFKYTIPVNIEMSNRYVLNDMTIDIDDFYYEIVDNNILSVSIEIGLDHLKEVEDIIPPIKYEKEIIEPVINETIKLEERKIEEKEVVEQNSRMNTEDVKSLFDSFDDSNETYATYNVCIIKESDTVESVLLKYGITRELLEQYNDLSDIKIGDKLIIPSLLNETS